MTESGISEQEKARAKALDAILVYDSLQKTRQTQSEISKQIAELHIKQPIGVDNQFDTWMPTDLESLEELAD